MVVVVVVVQTGDGAFGRKGGAMRGEREQLERSRA